MTEHVEMLREFNRVFGAYEARHPELPPADVAALRVALIKEEFGELRKALTLNDLVGVADAIADLLYVVHGTALACGIDIDPIFAEVHRSNMTKLAPCTAPFCRYHGDLLEGDPQSAKDGCSACNYTGYVVLRREDGKVLKPNTYEPPEIGKVLTRQMAPR